MPWCVVAIRAFCLKSLAAGRVSGVVAWNRDPRKVVRASTTTELTEMAACTFMNTRSLRRRPLSRGPMCNEVCLTPSVFVLMFHVEAFDHRATRAYRYAIDRAGVV